MLTARKNSRPCLKPLGACTPVENLEETPGSWLWISSAAATPAFGKWTSTWKKVLSVFPFCNWLSSKIFKILTRERGSECLNIWKSSNPDLVTYKCIDSLRRVPSAMRKYHRKIRCRRVVGEDFWKSARKHWGEKGILVRFNKLKKKKKKRD